MSKVFSGSKKQTQTNTSNSGKYLEQLLGTGGDPADGFNTYMQNAGYSGAVAQGLDDIDAGAAAAGLLRSGSTGKAYGNYVTQQRQNYYQNYIQNLLGTAAVENTQKAKSKEKPGLGGFLGSAASSVAAG